MQLSISQNVLAHFKGLGVTQDSCLKKEQLLSSLDFFLRKYSQLRVFSPKIKSKLWQQCEKNKNGTVNLSQFASVYAKQYVLTVELVARVEEEARCDEVILEEKIKLKKKLAQYRSQLKYLTYPFKLNLAISEQELQKLSEERKGKENPEAKIEEKECTENKDEELQKEEREEKQKKQRKIREFIAQKLQQQQLKHEKGDLFLQVYLKKKGISEQAIDFLSQNQINSLEDLSNITEQFWESGLISSNDSIILKEL